MHSIQYYTVEPLYSGHLGTDSVLIKEVASFQGVKFYYDNTREVASFQGVKFYY